MEGRQTSAGGTAVGEPEISVVVPVFNGGTNFARCLDAIAASPAGQPAWELIVIDDGSTDGSADLARAAGARVISTPRPRGGPAAARNLGATFARGDVLLFLDADVMVPPDAISRIASEFRQDPSLVALFGSYDMHPAAPNFLSQYKNLFHHYVHQNSLAEATTFWSGCGAIRRHVFFSFDGFDTTYGRPSIEDIELGTRLARAGLPVRLCHSLQVTHLKRWTPLSLLHTEIRDRGVPWTVLLMRERFLTDDLNLRKSDRVSAACTYLLLFALLTAALQPQIAVIAAFLMLVLLGLNLPLYRFFWCARGSRFMLATIPWHWFYYTYSGLSLILGVLVYVRNEKKLAASVSLETRLEPQGKTWVRTG